MGPGWATFSSVADPNAYRMLATGCAMGAATVIRAGVGCAEVWAERAPSLMKLVSESREGTSSAGTAQGQFRDELLAMARDSSEVALRELRRGLEDLDTFTRPEENPAAAPRRPYKAKP
jgi:hypothetical protein